MRTVCLVVLLTSALVGCGSSAPTTPTPSGGNGTAFGETPFYPFTIALSQSADQVTGMVREPRAAGDLIYPVTGTIRDGKLVIEADSPKDGEPLRVFNWARTSNDAATMAGTFTKTEAYHTSAGVGYTITTEHEFTGLSRAH